MANMTIIDCNFFKKFFFASLIFLTLIYNSCALSPEEKLNDPQLEERAMNLFLIVRCVVCNGQVIENSDTKFAYDMRQFIRQKIAAHKSDEEIKKELRETFGESILTEISNTKILVSLIFIAALILVIFLKIFLKKN